MQKKEVVWVVLGRSERGDNFGPIVFAHDPTQLELRNFVRSTGEELDVDGEGRFGSNVFLDITEQKVN